MGVDMWHRGQLRVGQVASRSRLVTRRDIELFTEISGDRNPLHYDEEFAAATSFGGIVVQGGVTTALLNAVVAEDLPGPGSVFLQLDLSFRAPVRPGDVITGTAEVTSARADKPITGLALRVTRDDGVVAVEGTGLCYTFVAAGAP
jgi:acyl dehydratase